MNNKLKQLAEDYVREYPHVAQKNYSSLARLIIEEGDAETHNWRTLRKHIADVIDSQETELLDGDIPSIEPRILIFDIETSPYLAYTWDVWQQNVPGPMIENHWGVLCWAAKWIGKDKMYFDSAHKHTKVENPLDGFDDFAITASLWELLDEADIVVAHNGKRFDIPKMNTKFLEHGMTPPSPYKIMDTKTVASKKFAFAHNSLKELAKFLKLKEQKGIHNGFSMWRDCMFGNTEAWDKMVEYCIQDIYTLEDVYYALRSWDNYHPSVGVHYNDGAQHCSRCGSTNLKAHGYSHTNTSSYKTYKCENCGAWSKSRINARSKENMKTTLMPIR